MGDLHASLNIGMHMGEEVIIEDKTGACVIVDLVIEELMFDWRRKSLKVSVRDRSFRSVVILITCIGKARRIFVKAGELQVFMYRVQSPFASSRKHDW